MWTVLAGMDRVGNVWNAGYRNGRIRKGLMGQVWEGRAGMDRDGSECKAGHGPAGFGEDRYGKERLGSEGQARKREAWSLMDSQGAAGAVWIVWHGKGRDRKVKAGMERSAKARSGTDGSGRIWYGPHWKARDCIVVAGNERHGEWWSGRGGNGRRGLHRRGGDSKGADRDGR